MPTIYEQDREDTIIQMADAMIDYDWRLLDIASNFECSLTTVYNYIVKELKYINDDKYTQCRNILNRHKHERLPRGGRY